MTLLYSSAVRLTRPVARASGYRGFSGATVCTEDEQSEPLTPWGFRGGALPGPGEEMTSLACPISEGVPGCGAVLRETADGLQSHLGLPSGYLSPTTNAWKWSELSR
jgi:hypothetical protein